MKSRITQKIARHMLVLYLCIMVIGLFVAIYVLFPIFYGMAEENAHAAVESICANYNTEINNASDQGYILSTMGGLDALIRQHLKEPDEHNKSNVNLFLNNFRSSTGLLFIMLEDENGNIYNSVNYAWSNAVDFIRSSPHYASVQKNKSTYISPVYEELIFPTTLGSSQPFYFYSSASTIDRRSYVLTLCVSAYSLIKTSNVMYPTALDSYAVINREGEIVYSSNVDFPEAVNDFTERFSGVRGSFRAGWNFYFWVRDPVSNFVVTGSSSIFTLAQFFVLLIWLFALCVVPLALFYIFMTINYRKILAPLHQLASYMREFSLGSMPSSILRTGDEIEELSLVFSEMTKNLNKQSDEIIQSEHEKAITSYKLMVTQLEPHFIYNSMNIINVLARQGQKEDVVVVNNALRRILRERLNTCVKLFEQIDKEIDTLRQYMTIMAYRYTGTVNVDYAVQNEIRDVYILKNIMQPLVENAFYHGLTREDGSVEGNISVMIYAEDEKINIEISDDGKGISPEKMELLTKNRFNMNIHQDCEDAHIGLYNIYERLSHIYKNDFDMRVGSTLGHGTTVLLVLPLHRDIQQYL